MDVKRNFLDDIGAAIRSAVPPRDLPDERTDSLFRIYAVLTIAKGIDVAPEDVHNAWSAWMSDIDPNHPALVPFEELGPTEAADDEPYVAAIHEVAKALHA